MSCAHGIARPTDCIGVECALLEILPEAPTVLLLDRFKDVVDRDRLGLPDEVMEAVLAHVHGPPHGLKMIVTTGVTPRDLFLFEPGSQRQLNLDESLPSPFAEQVLRDMDPDGILGLRDAPMELLTKVPERAQGFPHALEAIKGSLAADREALAELRARPLPHDVLQALVGEALGRLDSLGERVMEALAISPVPVPTVAVDYLLHSLDAAVDSAPVLARLVDIRFVHHRARRYYVISRPRLRSPARAYRYRRGRSPSRHASAVRPCQYAAPNTSTRSDAVQDMANPGQASLLSSRRSSVSGRRLDGAARVLLKIDRDTSSSGEKTGSSSTSRAVAGAW